VLDGRGGDGRFGGVAGPRRVPCGVVLLWVGLLNACAPGAHDALKRRAEAGLLAREICGKFPAVAEREARVFAEEAVETAAAKREEWGVRWTPWVHNMLVNSGKRPRGLCYEWQNTMYFALEEVVPAGLKMTLVEAHRGSPFREHHALSLHAVRGPWKEGVLLDGWSKGGNLYFKPVAEDDHPWQYEAEEPYAEGDRRLARPGR